MEKVWILLLESNKWRLLLHICLTSKARMSQTTGAHKNAHWSELRPLLAWLANDASKKATRSGQTAGWCWCTRATSPNCQRSLLRRVHYEAIDLIVSAIDQRFNQERFSSYAQMDPYWLKLLMVTTMKQSSSFLKHHTATMLIASERQTA